MAKKMKKKLVKRPMLKEGSDSIDKFLSDAEKPKTIGEKEAGVKGKKPWEKASVREDVLKVFNLRLPESYYLKLKYLAYHSDESQQKICLDVLLPAIDERIQGME